MRHHQKHFSIDNLGNDISARSALPQQLEGLSFVLRSPPRTGPIQLPKAPLCDGIALISQRLPENIGLFKGRRFICRYRWLFGQRGLYRYRAHCQGQYKGHQSLGITGICVHCFEFTLVCPDFGSSCLIRVPRLAGHERSGEGAG